MTKYYKKYELSLSLNGESIMHIARNAAGNVVFREHSEKALKSAIDESIENENIRLAEAERPKKTKTVVKILSVEQVPVDEANETQNVPETQLGEETQDKKPVFQRGPDGKFISKSALTSEESDDKKKGFWSKLTS